MEQLTSFIKSWTRGCIFESSSKAPNSVSTGSTSFAHDDPTDRLIQIDPSYNNYDRKALYRAIDLAG